MGIPVFFKTLITDYQHVIEPVDKQKIDNLFFDLNCLLHPSCASIKDGNEDDMINKILGFTFSIFSEQLKNESKNTKAYK